MLVAFYDTLSHEGWGYSTGHKESNDPSKKVFTFSKVPASHTGTRNMNYVYKLSKYKESTHPCLTPLLIGVYSDN